MYYPLRAHESNFADFLNTAAAINDYLRETLASQLQDNQHHYPYSDALGGCWCIYTTIVHDTPDENQHGWGLILDWEHRRIIVWERTVHIDRHIDRICTSFENIEKY